MRSSTPSLADFLPFPSAALSACVRPTYTAVFTVRADRRNPFAVLPVSTAIDT